MSYSLHMMGIEEEEIPSDVSGFSEESMFGIDKTELPSKEGMSCAVDAMDSFAGATDKALDVDINLAFHDAFPEDKSGFEKDANTEINTEEEVVDSNTIPAHNDEAEGFEDFSETIPSNVSAEMLASDDIVEESATGWDDLF